MCMIIIMILACTSCSLLNWSGSSEELIGRWVILTNPDNAEPHHTMLFTDEEFFILDDQNTIFEFGTLSNITRSHFDYHIIRQDHSPELENTDVFGEYLITDTIMSITFYDDETKQTRYVTFTAEKQP